LQVEIEFGHGWMPRIVFAAERAESAGRWAGASERAAIRAWKFLAAYLPGGFARGFHRVEGAMPFSQPVASPGVARMTLPVITGSATVNVNDGAEGGLLPGDVHVFVNVVAHRALDGVWTQTPVSANSAISMHAPCCAITTS
jgi:hypothetical protein